MGRRADSVAPAAAAIRADNLDHRWRRGSNVARRPRRDRSYRGGDKS